MQQLSQATFQRPAPAVVPAYGRRVRRASIKPRFRSEVSPEFMSALKEAMARQSSQIAKRLGVPQLCLQQDFDAAGHSGHVVWPAGIELATYLRNNMGPKLAGKKVLELGAGTGVVGLTAAALGASVTLTDLPPQLKQLQANALASLEAIRTQGGCLQVLECDLNAPNPAIAATKYDVVLAADLITQELLVEPLFALVAGLLKANPAALVLLSHHHREESIDARLAASLKPYGLRLEALQRPPRDDVEDIEILRLALRFQY